MTTINSFFRGMVLGMVAGAAVDMICSRPATRSHTTVGRAMHRFGDAVDNAVEDVRGCMR